jgi:hypothetical protein
LLKRCLSPFLRPCPSGSSGNSGGGPSGADPSGGGGTDNGGDGGNPGGGYPEDQPSVGGGGSPPFGSKEFGDEMHKKFQDTLSNRTNTLPKDWLMRTGPGQTGVDASYIGPPSRYPGFDHAELKPFSASGFNTFQGQLRRWGAPPGTTSLWMYDANGDMVNEGNW